MGEQLSSGLRATWLWDDTIAPSKVAEFARAERIGDVFLTVPWSGPTAAARALSHELRAGGVRVACLGSGADWADAPHHAAEWAGRAVAGGDFDAVHLDVEPWAADDWPAHAAQRLAGLARAVGAVRTQTALAVEVDVPAGHVTAFAEPFTRVMSAASAVTIMAYRDRAPAILDFSAAARRAAASVGRSYRIGVDTRPSAQPGTTFADQGRTTLERETAAVAAALRTDRHFAGIAVHDLTGWRALAP